MYSSPSWYLRTAPIKFASLLNSLAVSVGRGIGIDKEL